MIRMGKESALGPREVIDRAVEFFGPPGAGMRIANHGDCCTRFQGAGGYVLVETADIEGKSGSQVTIEGRQWDYQIKQFMGEL